MRKVVFLFGRFQVPTRGHEEMIRYGFNYAKKIGADFRVYTSKSQDPVKNPLPYQEKIRFLHQLFPGINIVDDPNVKTAFDICRQLSDQGVEDVTMVVGGDRVQEFRNAIGKYIMPRNARGFDPRKNFAFKNFNVVNSGGRKAGVSGTQMREYIKAGKFKEFAAVAPTTDKRLARAIFASAKKHLRENTEGLSRRDFHDSLMSFIDFSCNHLGIKEKPTVHYKDDKGEGQPSFGGYAPGDKKLYVYTKNRHPMDIFRTVAHELVHHKQNLDGRLGKNISKEGSTGSKIENEANADAGKIMRYFGAENPYYFDMNYVKENKAIILAGTPGSGKDKILKEAILPCGFTEVNADEFYKFQMSGNVVINGSFDYDRVTTIKEALELQGYETIMVFVNTSNEVSKQRNEARQGKGRVIAETTRFTKWKAAQDNLDKYDHLFEKVIEVKNDLDLNQSETVIQETYNKLIDSVSKEIEDFILSETDRRFETMLEQHDDFSKKRQNPVGGAGNWGTSKLTDRYAMDTPGQSPGKPKPMKVLTLTHKKQIDPIKGDRIGQELGYPKNPTMGSPFDDNASIGINVGISDPVGRWMVKEETKRRFQEKYGPLAEQKLKETADKLRESLVDPYSGDVSNVTKTSGPADPQRPDVNAEFEKTSLFGKRKNKLNRNRK